jgi:chorismate mutase/prephenate dehydratase
MGIDEIRKEINVIDDHFMDLLRQRLDAVAKITAYKIENDLPVKDITRENEIYKRAASVLGETYAPYGEAFFERLFTIGYAYQQSLLDEKTSLSKRNR